MGIPTMTDENLPFTLPLHPSAVLKDAERIQLCSLKIKLENLRHEWLDLQFNQKKFEKDLPSVQEKFHATEQATIADSTDENLLALLVAERRLNLFKSFMANADFRRAEIEKTGDGLLRVLYQIWRPLNAMCLPPGFITGGRLDQKISGALAEIEKILTEK